MEYGLRKNSGGYRREDPGCSSGVQREQAGSCRLMTGKPGKKGSPSIIRIFPRTVHHWFITFAAATFIAVSPGACLLKTAKDRC